MYYSRKFIHEEKISQINIQVFYSYTKVLMKDIARYLTREIVICILDRLYLSEIIIWSMALHLPLPKMYFGMTQELTAIGNIRLLEYFKNLSVSDAQTCDKSYFVFFPYLAGKFNQREILNWYEKQMNEELQKYISFAIEGAVEKEKLQALEWCLLRQQGNDSKNRKKAAEIACKYGSFEALKYLQGEKTARKHTKQLAANGHLHILRWVHEDGMIMYPIMLAAAVNHHLDIVTWVHSVVENPFKLHSDNEEFKSIIKSKKIFQFLRENGYM